MIARRDEVAAEAQLPGERDRPRPAPGGRRRRTAWLAAALLAVGVAAALAALRVGSRKLELPAAAQRERLGDGTWRDLFDTSGAAASVPVLLWGAAIVVAGLVAFPYVWLAARSLPDRGYALARVVGLLLVTWVAWWAASLRLLPFTRPTILGAFLVLAAGAAAITVRHRRELARWARTHRRLLLVSEGVFWSLFAVVLFVRWSNPDLWHATRGGEKPMDFAYLNAVAKSAWFPPYDPWFAGGQMNYYYFGFAQVAGLAKLTGIPPAVAYNLALPTLAALLGSASYCAALGLASRRSLPGRRPVAVAVLGAVLVTVIGNLGEVRVIADAVRGSIPLERWYWDASRVIRAAPGEPGPITEFPAFTFVYGDLHAHAMALPLAATALALTVALARGRLRAATTAPTLALLGLVLGALWVTNTWDLPTYALLGACGLALAGLSARGGRRTVAIVIAGVAGLAATVYVSFLPFHLRYASVFEGVERWRGSRTRLVDYLTIHGLFLFAIVSALLVQLALARDLGSVARSYRLAWRSRDRLGRHRALRRTLVRESRLHAIGVRAVPLALGLAAVCAGAGEWPTATAVVVGALAALAWPGRRRRHVPPDDAVRRRLVVLFVLAGLAITVAVEWLVVRRIDVGRVNTVFKLYLQVWLLWALAAAISVGTVYERLAAIPRGLRAAWRAGLVLLLATGLVYPVLAARAKIDDRIDPSAPRTLDGTAFMRGAVFTDRGFELPLAHDRAAIRWLLEHVDGSPVVAEANTTPVLYGWHGRYSMFTGNPTIVGWDYHQRQQRPAQSELVQARVADVQRAYLTTDPALAHRLLTRYGASYVVVGPLEEAYFGDGMAKWAAGTGRFWTLAYDGPGVRIYRLRPSAGAGSTR